MATLDIVIRIAADSLSHFRLQAIPKFHVCSLSIFSFRSTIIRYPIIHSSKFQIPWLLYMSCYTFAIYVIQTIHWWIMGYVYIVNIFVFLDEVPGFFWLVSLGCYIPCLCTSLNFFFLWFFSYTKHAWSWFDMLIHSGRRKNTMRWCKMALV